MTDAAKFLTKLNSAFSLLQTRRRTMAFTYGFMFALVAGTIFLIFNPNDSSSSPWLNRIFTTSTAYNPQFSSFYSCFFPHDSNPNNNIPTNQTSIKNTTSSIPANQTSLVFEHSTSVLTSNQTTSVSRNATSVFKNSNSSNPASVSGNSTSVFKSSNSTNQKSVSGNYSSILKNANSSNSTGTSLGKGSRKVAGSNSTAAEQSEKGQKEKAAISLEKCNLYDGKWVKDESYPLYPPGSCAIDEQYNCFLNGRPDRDHQMFRWQPNGCRIPRLNGTDMLERLRGKRLVFVGDSLNRNMWESLLCILRKSVKEKSRVYEVSGRHDFKSRGFFSFIFKDYNCSVEFFWAPFLVREWQVTEANGNSKETLRLDLIESSSPYYKNADVIVFNTGHWWTHEKTAEGRDYYQEGSHVYNELNVEEAFRRAITTWGRWVDANLNPNRTIVLFRGYSASHFSGGQWNSGGQCDDETEPIVNNLYLEPYPKKMITLESVLKGMKFPVYYMNVTRLTDYRKDGHPSIYRKQNMTEEERLGPHRIQDCSHWCLPGVPDAWNELLYAHLITKRQQH
ncbi:hypothetical protein ACLOJK_006665 [Asimina triloba]